RRVVRLLKWGRWKWLRDNEMRALAGRLPDASEGQAAVLAALAALKEKAEPRPPPVATVFSNADPRSKAQVNMEGVDDPESGEIWANNVADLGTDDGLNPATDLGFRGGRAKKR